jgi:hypothetical protein
VAGRVGGADGPTESLGRTSAITVLTPCRRGWARWLRADFRLLAALKSLMRQRKPSRKVRRLSFISFAHWAVVDRLPSVRLPYPYIVFHSNFNGGSTEYFEAFARALPWRMMGLWGGAYGVPRPRDLVGFSGYIMRHWVRADHYYAAYPHASTKMVLDALELRGRFDHFSSRAAGLAPEEFARGYAQLMERVQHNL